MAQAYKTIADLIDRLEIKVDGGLDTPEYLRSLQRQLDGLGALQDAGAGKAYHYALELQALIWFLQGNETRGRECLAKAVGQAGSIRKLFSRLLKKYAKANPVDPVAPAEPNRPSSAGGIDQLSSRDQAFLRKYGLQDAPDIQFFTRAPWVLVVFSLGMLFYMLYWSYCNWKAIQPYAGRRIRPFWRTVFNIFYLWPLLRIMELQARVRGDKPGIGAGWLTLGYFVPGYLAAIVALQLGVWVQLSVGILVHVASLCMLVVAQRAAIYNNLRLQTPALRYSRHGRLEWLFLTLSALGVIAYGMFMFSVVRQHSGRSFMQGYRIGIAQSRANQLTKLYNSCAAQVNHDRTNVNVNDPQAVQLYNQHVQVCENIRAQQHQAAAQYNALMGQ